MSTRRTSAEPNTSGFDFRDGLATLDLRFGHYTMIAKHSDEIRLWLHAGDAGGRAEPLPFRIDLIYFSQPQGSHDTGGVGLGQGAFGAPMCKNLPSSFVVRSLLWHEIAHVWRLPVPLLLKPFLATIILSNDFFKIDSAESMDQRGLQFATSSKCNVG